MRQLITPLRYMKGYKSETCSVLCQYNFIYQIWCQYFERQQSKVCKIKLLQKTSKFGELWSPARQQIWPWSRSKVKVTTWCQLKGPVTRIMHAKYQCSIINTSEDMSQVKVFVTDRGTEGRRDGRMRFNVPRFRERRGKISGVQLGHMQ